MQHGLVGNQCAAFSRPGRGDALLVALEERRTHYVTLGEQHSLTDIGPDRRVCYSGTPEVADCDEQTPGHVLVVDVDADRCQVVAHQIGTW